MKMQIKGQILILEFVLVCYGTLMHAQTAIPATGGNATGAEGNVSYTIGQVVYTTNVSSNGSVAQGVHQPYEISVVTGINQAEDIVIVCSVYPNPTSNNLALKVENYDTGNLSYKLIDSNGTLLVNREVAGTLTSIPMTGMVPGLYLLRIYDYQKVIKIFKIIKN